MLLKRRGLTSTEHDVVRPCSQAASGAFSGRVELAYGTTAISIVVTAGQYQIQNTYTLHVFRPVHTNAFLQDLAVLGHDILKFSEPVALPNLILPCTLYYLNRTEPHIMVRRCKLNP